MFLYSTLICCHYELFSTNCCQKYDDYDIRLHKMFVKDQTDCKQLNVNVMNIRNGDTKVLFGRTHFTINKSSHFK